MRALQIAATGMSAQQMRVEVAIEGKGYLEVTLPNGTSGFTRDGGLKRTGEALGSNLFSETGASGPAIVNVPGEGGLGLLRQGYLEDSSVDAVQEITDLIEAQRGYELNAKVITAADQMLGATTQIR